MAAVTVVRMWWLGRRKISCCNPEFQSPGTEFVITEHMQNMLERWYNIMQYQANKLSTGQLQVQQTMMIAAYALINLVFFTNIVGSVIVVNKSLYRCCWR